jgi:WD40 repeat protein
VSNNLQGVDGRSQMGSGLPRYFHVIAHDSRQVLTFQGKSCSLFTSFTRFRKITEQLKEFVLIRTLTGHTSEVVSVAISADGQTLASGSEDKTIKLWKKQ